jgi:hypothetical protein
MRLAAFIQQRIRHVHRRQRSTPLPSRAGEEPPPIASESMVSMSRIRGVARCTDGSWMTRLPHCGSWVTSMRY